MKKLLILAALAALFAGCSVTKINYEKDDKGAISYRIYRNDHWLKTDASGIKGGMSDDGKFEFSAEGLKSSPSEEFNRTMQTYTTAFVQLAQIAAAAYNPSASMAAAKSESSKAGSSTIILEAPKAETQPGPGLGIALTSSQDSTEKSATSDPHSAECADGGCTDCEVK